ncbi:MAG: Rad52/Rad22 family DNA repair protein [Cyanobium sp.]
MPEGFDVDLGQAHESALKEAETDAMKRALMTFGNPFGLALYDKQQREVTGATGGGDRPSVGQAGRPRTTPLRVVSPTSAQPMARTHGMEAQSEATSKTEPPTPDAVPSALDPALAPLDPATIHQLHATIRGLPAPVLDRFSKAFRKRFQVPVDAPSIAVPLATGAISMARTRPPTMPITARQKAVCSPATTPRSTAPSG